MWLQRTDKGGGESWGQRGDGWLGRGPSRALVFIQVMGGAIGGSRAGVARSH